MRYFELCGRLILNSSSVGEFTWSLFPAELILIHTYEQDIICMYSTSSTPLVSDRRHNATTPERNKNTYCHQSPNLAQSPFGHLHSVYNPIFTSSWGLSYSRIPIREDVTTISYQFRWLIENDIIYTMIVLLLKFLFVIIFLFAGVYYASDRHTGHWLALPESKQNPPLKSGNLVITAELSIVISSNQPDISYPPTPEYKQQQGLDILRGITKHIFNSTTGMDDIQTSIIILDIPNLAIAKWCSFHFFFGSGDSLESRNTCIIWSLDTLPLEFETSWNNRPGRQIQLAEFYPSVGAPLSQGLDGNDAIFKYEDTRMIPKGETKIIDGSVAFPCDPFLGKRAYEIVSIPGEFDEKGHSIAQASAWSMNKGLMIEIHD